MTALLRITLSFSFSVCWIFPDYGQKPAAALGVLADKYPVEKIYIHYDKDYYVAGETVWFKAYLYSNNQPSGSSNNFYLRLIDGTGKVIAIKKYPVKGATVRGDILLPDSLAQGNYIVQALTPLILNNSPEFLYQKNLFVFNTSRQSGYEAKESSKPSPVVKFFPESGNLVADIPSVIAFKAVDAEGQPMNINGVIKTEDGTLISTFKTFHDGMGKFQLRPQAGKKYIAVVDVGGQIANYSLPAVQAAGINLRVENEKTGKMFQLTRTKLEKDKFNKLWLVAQMHNRIVYESEIFFDNYYSVKGHLITDSLPSGILHFTVFNEDGMPLAERLTFINNREYESNTVLELVKQGTGKREENIFDLKFPFASQRSFSVAITDINATAENGEPNIISKLLLTDDLKGQIRNPNWYFENPADSTRQIAMEDLLMTHGWSRFNWEKILAGKFPEKKYNDNYLIRLTGSLKDSKTKERVSSGGLVIYLDGEDSISQNFEVNVAEDGTFFIDSLLFSGRSTIYYAYKTSQGKEKTVDIQLDETPFDLAVEQMDVEKDMSIANWHPRANENLLAMRTANATSVLSKPKELETVVVKSAPNKRPVDLVNEKYAKGLFTGMGKINIDNINQPHNDRSISVFDYLRTFLSRIEVEDNNFVSRRNFSLTKPPTKKQENDRRIVENAANLSGLSPGPPENYPGRKFIVAVFLNESPTDVGALKTIRMNDIALIKFYEPGFIGAGSGGPGGAISIYTKDPGMDPGPGPGTGIEKLDHVIFNGYSITKEFYSPDYNLPNYKHSQEDNRVTLYWNPELYTDDESNSIRVKFFNNDFTKSYRIIVTGFDAMGRLIYAEKIIREK